MEMLKKSQIIDMLQSLPDEVEMEDVIERIILLFKIQRARRQIDNGQFYTNDEVKAQYKKWLH
jgi:hypothetical protein